MAHIVATDSLFQLQVLTVHSYHLQSFLATCRKKCLPNGNSCTTTVKHEQRKMKYYNTKMEYYNCESYGSFLSIFPLPISLSPS